MNSIVTFYSYKGGVGRSMALANIAVELSKKKMKVLMIDWDLEAPGLERYFSQFISESNMNGNGLLPLLCDVKNGLTPDYKKFLWKIEIPSQVPISLLHSGREKDIDYAKKLENFGWEDFFSKNGGGAFLEILRNQWKEDFDIVLIDSRTGLSDSSGICTIFLPDIIVPIFTANFQSLYGVRDLIRLAQSARQKLDTDRTPLTILPVPARFGARAEFKESQEWLDRFAEALKEFYSDWLPKWITPKQVLERIKIPQVDYFSFGEKLAVMEQGTSDPEGMGYIYAKIASLLASDFKDVDIFIGEQYKSQKEDYEMQQKQKIIPVSSKSDSYLYDVFLSYSQSSANAIWIREIFLPLFKNYLDNELDYEPKIFFDIQEIQAGELWAQSVQRNLNRSKVLIAFITPVYLGNEWSKAELQTFLERSMLINMNIVFPVLLNRGEYLRDSLINNIQWIDFSEFNFAGDAFFKSAKYLDIQIEIRELAKRVAKTIYKVPGFNNNWPVVDLKKGATTVAVVPNTKTTPKFE